MRPNTIFIDHFGILFRPCATIKKTNWSKSLEWNLLQAFQNLPHHRHPLVAFAFSLSYEYHRSLHSRMKMTERLLKETDLSTAAPHGHVGCRRWRCPFSRGIWRGCRRCIGSFGEEGIKSYPDTKCSMGTHKFVHLSGVLEYIIFTYFLGCKNLHVSWVLESKGMVYLLFLPCWVPFIYGNFLLPLLWQKGNLHFLHQLH